MGDIKIHLLVMVFMMAVDMAWTMYMIEVERRRELLAGLWSAGIMLFGSFVTLSYVEDKRYLVSAAIGAFLGTAGTVYYKKRKEKKDGEG